jgi:diketogulonate reductase-like aldo/keto reductase
MKLVSAGGAQIPSLGLGTWQLKDDIATQIVREAIAGGYRHIDTARMYDNEAAVGRGIAEAPVPRDDVFLTTKIWPTDHGAKALTAAAEDSVKTLGVDHVDLLLLHWPSRDVPLEETIEALNTVRSRGLTRHIGVSNFNCALLDKAARLSDAPLVTNQVEYHPFLDQSTLLAGLRAHGMSLTSYCPIAKGEVVGNPVLKDIAARHSVSEVQITLAWHVAQDGVIAIPRSSKIERVMQSMAALDLTLSEEEMTAITALGSAEGRMVHMPDFAPEWDT